MALTTSWAPFFSGSTKMRGRTYLNEDRVKPVSQDTDTDFRATVRGENDHTYEVVIVVGNNRARDAQCTCPAFIKGHYCKHLWATLLYMEEHHIGSNGDDSGQADSNGKSKHAFVDTRLPKARKRTGERVEQRQEDPQWMTRLSLLRTPGYQLDAEQERFSPDLRQICYFIEIDRCMENSALIVQLQQRTPTAKGWSKAKPIKLSASAALALSDPIDREICSLLQGADDTGDDVYNSIYGKGRARSVYQIPFGARHTMMQRMIATGRCFISTQSGEDIAVRWDATDDMPPWALWMVGNDDEDGNLSITVELRRYHRPKPISEPRLILGGANGLVFYDDKVAPFDDRGAFRWVTHFRDDLHKYGEIKPIFVARDDIERFLDRLYLLPNLPELDLPESVSRAEQHIKPVPYLEIYNPGGSNSKQLAANVWFRYGTHDVKPGQPGRFISSTVPPVESTDGPDADPDWDESADDAIAQDIPAEPVEDESLAADDEISAAPVSEQSILIRRDHRLEERYYVRLLNLGLRPMTSGEHDRLALPVGQMPDVVTRLIGENWQVVADRKIIRQAGAPSLSVSSGIDWFELRGSISYQTEDGVQTVDLPRILQAAREGRVTIKLDDGSEGLLPREWLAEHGLLTAMGQLENDHLRFRTSQAALIDALLSDQPFVNVDEKFAAARERLRAFEGVQPGEPAETFNGSLRQYQREGIGWLEFLRWFGMGGILADDMGLGKTIQVLAVLDKHYSRSRTDADQLPPHEQVHRPSLIVVPRSVVFNWIDEAQKFAPNLRIEAYTGVERHNMREDFARYDVIITSYGLMRRDIEELRQHTFDYIVLDEAQAIKNPASQSAKAARLLEGSYRLALTGTPVENHIGDLWSIFEYLNPGMLGSNTRFAETLRRGLAAVTPGNGGKTNLAQPEAAMQIARAIRPFILRRRKDQVLDDLPPKTEQTIHCEMEPAQRKIYDELRLYYRNALLKQSTNGTQDAGADERAMSGGKAGNSMMVLEALLRLRQAACHPGLIDPARIGDPSAKTQELNDRLTDLIDEGHKTLVFSQFTSMLAIVRKQLESQGIDYAYLDGQTRDRKRVVDRFQNDPDCKVFLISLKAGGVGLNLTAAEYVFILDPWWNPAVEAQAIDRTHRIGQTQHVFAYRLICENTVEQRILELQDRKRKLADAIVGGQENVLRSLTREDLEQLLS